MLIPTWVLLLVWTFAAWLTVTGHLVNDVVQPALAGGLVLIVLLIGFTVMQHAFAGGVVVQGPIGDTERRALALTGAGDIVWDWDVARDRIYTGPEAEDLLGLRRGSARRAGARLAGDPPSRRPRPLQGHARHRGRAPPRPHRAGFPPARGGRPLPLVPPPRPAGARLRRRGAALRRHAARRHRGAHGRGAAPPRRRPRQPHRPAQPRALPRPAAGGDHAHRAEGAARPSVFILDIDRFKQVNDGFGLAVGDSILLTIARRLARLLKPQDTLARLGGDQFAFLLISESQPERIAAFAESVRRTLRAPITLGEKEIFLTASIGIAMHDGKQDEAEEMVKDAEIGMYHAKRLGGDRIEAFRPALRQHGSDLATLEADLRRALGREEIKVLYQPIVRLEDKTIAGFEALVRWDHPKLGRIPPSDFIPIAERTGLIIPLGLFVLDRTARQLADWQEDLGRTARSSPASTSRAGSCSATTSSTT